MKKTAFCLATLLSLSCASAAAFGILPATEIYGSLSIGGLVSGYQKDMPTQMLSPAPDNFTALLPIIGIRHYVFGGLGIEGSFGLFGTTSAMSPTTEPLKVYDYSVVTLGLVARHPVALDYESFLSIFGGAGITYSIVTLSQEFTSLFAAVGEYFYDVKPDYGWYGKAGIAYYMSRHLFFDLTAYYFFLNAHFDVIDLQLAGNYLLVAVTLGVAL